MYQRLRNGKIGVMELLVVAAKTNPSRTGSKEELVADNREAHQLKTVDVAWHCCRILAVKHNLTMGQWFEAAVMVISKYEDEPQKIGPKLMEAIKTLKEKPKENGRPYCLTMDEI